MMHKNKIPEITRSLVLILCAGLILVSTPVYAMTKADVESIKNGTAWYDPFDQRCTQDSASASTVLVGSDNASKIWNFLIGKGLKPEQAAGVMGNLYQESKFNPSAQQDGIADPFPKANVGFGLAQWTSPGRQNNLSAFGKEQNKPLVDLGLQLDFLWRELSTSYKNALNSLQQASTARDATFVFHRDFEKSADTMSDIETLRIKPAENFLAQYGGGTGNSSSTICQAAGGVTKFADNFSFFEQCDPNWGKKIYGDSATMCQAGCGPTSMAMIITNLTGKVVNPYEVASYGAQNGTWVSGVGSSWTIASVSANHWGLKSAQISKDVTKINAILQSGGLVLMSGTGKIPFTSAGHFIVIRGVTSDGKWKLADPFPYHPEVANKSIPNTNEVTWNPTDILSADNIGVWGITK